MQHCQAATDFRPPKALAKSAKVTLVLDPLSITRVNSEGKKTDKANCYSGHNEV